MRLVVTALMILTATVIAAGTWPGASTSVANASTGNMVISPASKLTAWNADVFSVDIRAENIDTTTQCAIDPNDPQSPTADCGLGAFEFTVQWDPAVLNYVSVQFGPFLTSTGRPISCFPPNVGADTVTFACVTLGPSPLGPEGSGTIATISFEPLAVGPGGTTPLTFTDTHFNDIAGAAFPAAPTGGVVQFGVCMDLNGDTLVDFSDTLEVLSRFGLSVPPEDPKYDPTADGLIDFSDALYSLAEFGQSCTL